VAAGLDLGAHGGDARAAAFSVLRVPGPARRDISRRNGKRCLTVPPTLNRSRRSNQSRHGSPTRLESPKLRFRLGRDPAPRHRHQFPREQRQAPASQVDRTGVMELRRKSMEIMPFQGKGPGVSKDGTAVRGVEERLGRPTVRPTILYLAAAKLYASVPKPSGAPFNQYPRRYLAPSASQSRSPA
jgi:hypothetical protein